MKCLCCGKEAIWCDSEPDEDGDMHQCDHIRCNHCKMDYTLAGHKESFEAKGFKEMKEIMLRVYSQGLTPDRGEQ